MLYKKVNHKQKEVMDDTLRTCLVLSAINDDGSAEIGRRQSDFTTVTYVLHLYRYRSREGSESNDAEIFSPIFIYTVIARGSVR